MAAQKRKTPSVNILKKQQNILRVQSRRLELISSLSLSILIFYCVGFVMTLFYVGYLKGSLMVLDRKIEDEKKNMEVVEEVRENYFLLKDRAKAISDVSASVGRHQAVIEKVLAFFPEGVSVRGMTINEKGLIEFSVKAKSIEDVEYLLEKIKKEKDTNNLVIDYARVDSLKVSESGEYSFEMSLAIVNMTNEKEG